MLSQLNIFLVTMKIRNTSVDHRPHTQTNTFQKQINRNTLENQFEEEENNNENVCFAIPNQWISFYS